MHVNSTCVAYPKTFKSSQISYTILIEKYFDSSKFVFVFEFWISDTENGFKDCTRVLRHERNHDTVQQAAVLFKARPDHLVKFHHHLSNHTTIQSFYYHVALVELSNASYDGTDYCVQNVILHAMSPCHISGRR